jgi:hypothetical protein
MTAGAAAASGPVQPTSTTTSASATLAAPATTAANSVTTTAATAPTAATAATTAAAATAVATQAARSIFERLNDPKNFPAAAKTKLHSGPPVHLYMPNKPTSTASTSTAAATGAAGGSGSGNSATFSSTAAARPGLLIDTEVPAQICLKLCQYYFDVQLLDSAATNGRTALN